MATDSLAGFMLFAWLGEADAAFRIVEAGQPRAEIRVAEYPPRFARLAAEPTRNDANRDTTIEDGER